MHPSFRCQCHRKRALQVLAARGRPSYSMPVQNPRHSSVEDRPQVPMSPVINHRHRRRKPCTAIETTDSTALYSPWRSHAADRQDSFYDSGRIGRRHGHLSSFSHRGRTRGLVARTPSASTLSSSVSGSPSRSPSRSIDNGSRARSRKWQRSEDVYKESNRPRSRVPVRRLLTYGSEGYSSDEGMLEAIAVAPLDLADMINRTSQLSCSFTVRSSRRRAPQATLSR